MTISVRAMLSIVGLTAMSRLVEDHQVCVCGVCGHVGIGMGGG